MLEISVVLCGALQHANERVNLLKLVVDGRIILEEYGLRVWLDSFSHRKKIVGIMKVTLVTCVSRLFVRQA
jgi:hypothetical protein